MRAAVGSHDSCFPDWRPRLRDPTMACPALESSRAVCAGSDLSGSLEEGEDWT